MKHVVAWFWFLAWILLLPLLGWWLASRVVPNPPIVAPFLVTSPLYAFWIATAAISVRHIKERKTYEKPLVGKEIDDITTKYEKELGRFSGQIATISEDYLSQPATRLGTSLVLNEQVWDRLNNSGREFMLIRAALRNKRGLPGFLISALCFLAAFTLASISLWLILPIHVSAVMGLVWYSTRFASTYEQNRDRVALAVTRDYKGAWNYIQHTKKKGEAVGERIEALKQSALDLGMST